MKKNPPVPCPCDENRLYKQCCQPYHTGIATAPTAEALMRSRYSAYALDFHDYLVDTWHPSSRPQPYEAEKPAPRWLGLTVKRSWQGQSEKEAFVEFVARFRIGGGKAGKIHESSRFVFESGRWWYLDGQFHENELR